MCIRDSASTDLDDNNGLMEEPYKDLDNDGRTRKEPCIPECSNRECGPDPICGQSCGICSGCDNQCIDYHCQPTSHHHFGCHANDVYWFDSCGTVQDIKEACAKGFVCVDGVCPTLPDNCGTYICADTHALPLTRAVFCYIRDLPHGSGKRILNGQMFLGPTFNYESRISQLHDNTGEWIALAGSDYWGEWPWIGPPKYQEVNADLIRHFDDGGLITLSLLLPNPFSFAANNPRGYFDTDLYGFNFSDLYTEDGNAVNLEFRNMLDETAVGFRDLDDNGVVVLFRPFLEMNGFWFWWGNQSLEQFKQLWKYTFDYLTSTKDLHNIIWIYSAASSQPKVTDYYPGDAYVDIVGLDFYADDWSSNNADIMSAYENLLALSKPFAFTEAGFSINENSPCWNGGCDNRIIIDGVSENYPAAVYIFRWRDDPYAIIGQEYADEYMDHAWFVNRDDICLPGVLNHQKGC